MVIYWAAEMWKIMELFWPKKPVKCGANLLQNKKRIFAKNEKMNRQKNRDFQNNIQKTETKNKEKCKYRR